MTRRTLTALVLLALLSLGVEGCHTLGGGPCCQEGDARLVAAVDGEPCCEPSAPPALQEASASTKNGFHPALALAFALAPADFTPAEGAISRSHAARPHPLYRLDCALLL